VVLELYRVGQVAEAEHNLVAGVHAALAAEMSCGPDAERRQHAQLLAGCAAADGADPAWLRAASNATP
jgi:hypothetical protein